MASGVGMPDDAAAEDEHIGADVLSDEELRPHVPGCSVLIVLGAVVEDPAVCAHRVQVVDWLAEDGEVGRDDSMWCTEEALFLSDQEFVVRPAEFGIRLVGVVVFERDYDSLGT
jgi:hypothetical protein